MFPRGLYYALSPEMISVLLHAGTSVYDGMYFYALATDNFIIMPRYCRVWFPASCYAACVSDGVHVLTRCSVV